MKFGNAILDVVYRGAISKSSAIYKHTVDYCNRLGVRGTGIMYIPCRCRSLFWSLASKQVLRHGHVRGYAYFDWL